MTEWYGHKWGSAFGAKPLESWGYGLAGLTDDELQHGLDSIRNRVELWPPSLPEFRAMCRPPDKKPEAAHMPVHRALPVPEEVREHRKKIGMAAIANCRRILAGEKA
jgi:hypothetical protein